MKNVLFCALCVLFLAVPLRGAAATGTVVSSSSETVASDSLLRNVIEKVASKSKKSSDSTTTAAADDEEETAVEVSAAEDEAAEDTASSSSKSSSSSKVADLVCDVIGLNKMKESTLVGKWTYKSPAVAFTSENLLAEAGGAVAASACESQLVSAYSSLGITSSNTSFEFKDSGSFTATLLGHSVKGTYTFDEDNQAIKLKVLVLTITGYTKKNSDGMSLMFESEKILELIEAICKISGSDILSLVGSLTSAYDGLRIGFDLTN